MKARVTGHLSPVTAFVALGSNLDDPVAQIRRAFASIAALPRTRVVRTSSLYRNPPVGFLGQPDFVNAVAMIETGLEPRELLDRLLAIEQAQGRVRTRPDGPRTLDLDLALYGDQVIEEPSLTVPHPRLAERAFVLVPIAELAPDAEVPGKGRIADLVKSVDVCNLAKIADG